MRVRRLVDFPYVLVRLRCDVCKRAGAYRLARLAVKYGTQILLDDLIVRLSADCPWRDDPRGGCGAPFAGPAASAPAGPTGRAHAISGGQRR
jgi:hypothetical protein